MADKPSLSEQLKKLANALDATQDIIHQGSWAIRQCLQERDNAVAGHEGQRRNTLAFMREAEVAKQEIERLRAGIQAHLDGDYPNPRQQRPGKCEHGTNYYEPCEQCSDAHLTALLNPDQPQKDTPMSEAMCQPPHITTSGDGEHIYLHAGGSRHPMTRLEAERLFLSLGREFHPGDMLKWFPATAETPRHPTPYITINGHHLSPDQVQTIAVALASMDILNVSYLEANGVSREVAAQFPERAREILEMMAGHQPVATKDYVAKGSI